MEKILVIGSNGQLGSDLVPALMEKYGVSNVISSDLHSPENLGSGIFEELNVLDNKKLYEVIDKHRITQIYHLAAMLSAKGEQSPLLAWKLNMDSLLNVLEIARNRPINKIFWPSSIAVFGRNTPKESTPQLTITEPNTSYGISKLAGERWCEYYFEHYGVDVRSLRYPGLIGYKGLPGGGTTDFSVDIFHKATKGVPYTCFLSEQTKLPLMFMDDAIRGTLELMEAPKENISLRSSYNFNGITASPVEFYNEIIKTHPNFKIEYKPDFRQEIANSWPYAIDDKKAKLDWGWSPEFNLTKICEIMLREIQP